MPNSHSEQFPGGHERELSIARQTMAHPHTSVWKFLMDIDHTSGVSLKAHHDHIHLKEDDFPFPLCCLLIKLIGKNKTEVYFS